MFRVVPKATAEGNAYVDFSFECSGFALADEPQGVSQSRNSRRCPKGFAPLRLSLKNRLVISLPRYALGAT